MNSPAAPTLYAWPAQAMVNRPLAKSKIYEHGKPTTAVRALFVAQVEQVTWLAKLAPESINLPTKPGVPEIEVFEIALKTPELNEAVLRCIDRAIPFPIVFELRFEGRTRLVAAFKRPSDAKPGEWVVSDYFFAPWQAHGPKRQSLPVALDLRGLYEQLLRPLMPLAPRAGESMKDQMERISLWRSGHNQAARLQTRLQQEKQFNRKVALNSELRGLTQHLGQLAQ